MNDIQQAIEKAQRRANTTAKEHYVFLDCGAYQIGTYQDTQTFYQGAKILHEIMPRPYYLYWNAFIDYVIANTEPSTAFNDIKEMVNYDNETDLLILLAAEGKTLEQFKAELLKACYNILKDWNKIQPKKRRENEYWIKSFNRLISR
jgi:hypothetical protein